MSSSTESTKQRMQFVIRDDDLCYFSSPDDITRWYQPVFDRGIPVSFSVIPFVTPTCDAWLPRPLPVHDNKEYPVSENKPLLAYCAAQPLADIALHGYTHETVGTVFEYQASRGLYEKTLKGKQELERAFNRAVTVFVAPHDKISSHGINAIESSKLHLIRGKGTTNILLRITYFRALFAMLVHRLRFIRISRNSMPAYPYAIHLGKHDEAYGIRIESDRIDLFKALRFAYECGGNFILVNHIHDFSEEKQQLMLKLIEAAKKLDAQFISASDLFASVK